MNHGPSGTYKGTLNPSTGNTEQKPPREPDCPACKDTGIYLGAMCHVCAMSHR